MSTRSCTIDAFAKINLGLKVLHKRPDGFHELRTVFQTVSLADQISIEYTPAESTELEIDSAIPDNLIVRAAERILAHLETRARIRFHLEKRIPVGGGLGGGSSDAAAVLLAVPVLAGRRIGMEELSGLAALLGSDVPFFLLGGAALGIGRGTEIYGLPDLPPAPLLIAEAGLHVSTAEAYRALGRTLTSEVPAAILNTFQSFVRRLGDGASGAEWRPENDFEAAVFEQHPGLEILKGKLRDLGACPAVMSGSGSSLFGVYESQEQRDAAARALAAEVAVHSVDLISRSEYRRAWWGRLREHIQSETWPPQSRYAQ